MRDAAHSLKYGAAAPAVQEARAASECVASTMRTSGSTPPREALRGATRATAATVRAAQAGYSADLVTAIEGMLHKRPPRRSLHHQN